MKCKRVYNNKYYSIIYKVLKINRGEWIISESGRSL